MRPRESSGGERGQEEMSNGMQTSKTGVCEVGREEEERRKVKDSMPGKMNEML